MKEKKEETEKPLPSRRYICIRCGAKGRRSKQGRGMPPVCPGCVALNKEASDHY